MQKKIIAFSGKKLSGKSTACNFIVGLIMTSLGVTSKAEIKDDGSLYVYDILVLGGKGQKYKPKDYAGTFDVFRNTSTMQNFLGQYLDPFVQVYSFADLLKQNIAMDILGLSYEDVYTEEGKERESNISWENIPGINNKTGYLSNREILQVLGTDIFRKIKKDVWSESTIRRIQDNGSALSLITDARFPEELDAIHNAGGISIRLLRNSNSSDKHKSETALDNYNNFTHILDNSKMNINEQNIAIYDIIKDIDCVPNIE